VRYVGADVELGASGLEIRPSLDEAQSAINAAIRLAADAITQVGSHAGREHNTQECRNALLDRGYATTVLASKDRNRAHV